LAIAERIEENSGIQLVAGDLRKIRVDDLGVDTLLYPILNAVSLLNNSKHAIHFEKEEELFSQAIERRQPPRYTIFSPGDSRTLLSFRFDGIVPLLMIRESLKRGDPSWRDDVKRIVEYSLNYCRLGNGYTGFRRSNSDRISQDNIQHSAFFGQWLKAGALITGHAENLTLSAVFNERGHLILSDALLKAQKS
jgi:hypothetical protein